jgi:hypothetical protein
MNKIILVVVLITNFLYGQLVFNSNNYLYNKKLSEIKINVGNGNISSKRNSKHISLYLIDFIKLTASTRINNNVLDNIVMGNFVNVATYDIRIKIYLSKRVSLTNRFFVIGFNPIRYFNTTALNIKF